MTILGMRGQTVSWSGETQEVGGVERDVGGQDEEHKTRSEQEESTPPQNEGWIGQRGGGGGPFEVSEGWVGVNEGRGWRWQGRRSAETKGHDEKDKEKDEEDSGEEEIQGQVEKRLQHASIRHRKSRRNFVRTRKSPKMRPRSHPEEDDDEDEDPTRTRDFEITVEIEQPSEDQGHSERRDNWGEVEWSTFGSTTPTSPSSWSSSGAPNLENKLRAMGDLIPTGDYGLYDEDGNYLGEGVAAGEGEDDLHLSGEGGRSRGEADVDVMTKFLRIVESQHLLGENCTKGTDFNLGEGVVDRYAQERFKLVGEIAVNKANLFTRLWKYSPTQVLASEYLLHAEVLTMVELNEDIFAAGNCYDKYEYKDYILFCPFAYRLPEGNILVKNLAVEYKYMSNTSEWFFFARKNAERAIRNYTELTKGT